MTLSSYIKVRENVDFHFLFLALFRAKSGSFLNFLKLVAKKESILATKLKLKKINLSSNKGTAKQQSLLRTEQIEN